MSQQPSELTDVFIHPENNEEVAYHAGNEIARRERGGQERFYAELHVWVRKTQFKGAFWRVSPSGEMVLAQDVMEKAQHAFDPQQVSEPNV